jgi:PIN domain nuclease of toxin-antitoxin system
MMGYILDTNALIFYLYNPEQLSKAALNIVSNENNRLYVSIVSLWEIAIKSSIGKLGIKNSLEEIAGICLKNKIELLAINPSHLDQIANLPQIHSDPFDRLIISQALVENLEIVTRDSIIPKYDVKTVW